MSTQFATLALEDGTVFYGIAFGLLGDGYGEVCFNTSMSGYQEILTDPSYAGQMVCMTYPHIGNVGVNPLDMESRRPWVGGFIIRELSPQARNFRAKDTLDSFLKKWKIPGIAGIDTRALTKRLRDKGAQRGVILKGKISAKAAARKAFNSPSYVGVDWASKVSTDKPYHFGAGLESGMPNIAPPELGLVDVGFRAVRKKEKKKLYTVVAIDCGIKINILRNLIDAGCDVHVLPTDSTVDEAMALKPDGVFLSNGPGDPRAVKPVIACVKELLAKKVPIFGICLGHQMLTLALGAKIKKLKFGHRGGNQPVKDLLTGKVEITSQNHGFAADAASFKGKPVFVSHLGLNDGVCEGLIHKTLPVFSVQYHPEASPGPHDANYLFTRFTQMMRTRRPIKKF